MTKICCIDHVVAQRWKHLGAIGEALAVGVLEQASFSNIENLNETEMNFPFGDILASRGNQLYVISVKARNKFEVNGKLNNRYKLGSKCYEHAQRAENRFGAVAAWLTIALDVHTFSAYFGELRMLNGKRGIRMTPEATAKYECLARNQAHGARYESFRNTYQQIPEI